MKLVGINGFKTSGKDTVFGVVQDYAGTDSAVARAGFADKLKIMAARALGFEGPNDELITLMDEAKEDWLITLQRNKLGGTGMTDTIMGEHIKTLTGRQYLQWFGGNAREVFGDTFWIDQVLPKPNVSPLDNSRLLVRRYPGVDLLCITDVRYENEAERVKALGGVVWEVMRPGLESDGHSSEKPLPGYMIDHTILNDSDLTNLRSRVVEAIGATL